MTNIHYLHGFIQFWKLIDSLDLLLFSLSPPLQCGGRTAGSQESRARSGSVEILEHCNLLSGAVQQTDHLVNAVKEYEDRLGLAGLLDDVLEVDNYGGQVCGDSLQADVEIIAELLADRLQESYHGVTGWRQAAVSDYHHWLRP